MVAFYLVDFPLEFLFMVTDYLDLASLSLFSWLVKHLYVALIGKLYFIAFIYTCKLSGCLITRLSNVTLYHGERKRGIVLEWAAIYDYIFTFKSLLKKLKANIYLRDPYRNILLYLLAGQGKTILIKLLLKAGVDILEYNIFSFILLHFTTKWGFMDAV
jgi:hypothetical protein